MKELIKGIILLLCILGLLVGGWLVFHDPILMYEEKTTSSTTTTSFESGYADGLNGSYDYQCNGAFVGGCSVDFYNQGFQTGVVVARCNCSCGGGI